MAERIRYAVVGLGHISQVAVLPAFEHAENAEVTALVSSDETKLKELAKRHGVKHLYGYDDYDRVLESGEVDAVYIALPNHMHREYSARAAEEGIHVLCEKPMAVTEEECRAMIEAAEDNDVKLMVAYRLHFEEANMRAVELVQSGKLGDPRLFESVFTMDVKEGDIRLQADKGGGTLYDIGVYCINAARYLFRAEPTEVVARTESRDEPRFREVEEMASVTLRFPDDRLASFITSFGSSSVEAYRVVGTEGSLRMEPAYSYSQGLSMEVTIGDGEPQHHHFEKRDQFAPQLVHFSRCILEGERPEPDGHEGLIDIRIIQAAYRSAEQGRPIPLEGFPATSRPGMRQEMKKPPVDEKPEEIHAEGPRTG